MIRSTPVFPVHHQLLEFVQTQIHRVGDAIQPPHPLSSHFSLAPKMGIPDHLTCLLRNLCAGEEATVRTGHGTTDCFQIGKGVRQGCMLSSCLSNFYAEYIMRNAGLEEA